MENKSLWFHPNKSFNAILWTKVVKVDGLKLILISWKELIWWLKIVLHIKLKQKEGNVVTMKNASQQLRFKILILLVEDGQRSLKNKWWKKFW